VALHAKSLLTEIVITNADRVANINFHSGSVTVGKDIILEVTLTEAVATETATSTGKPVTSEAIAIPNPTGLHARPAAVLANLSKTYQSKVRLHHGDDSANVKSIVALMNLDIKRGDTVTLTAEGRDAEDAILALTKAIANGLGEGGSSPVAASASIAQSDRSDRSRYYGRDSGGGNPGRTVCPRSRFLLNRHQRPDPIHFSDRSRSS
jgi:multiphosphoryl transfer protein